LIVLVLGWRGADPTITDLARQNRRTNIMGITIHYRLRSEATDAEEARNLVAQLRSRALDLPFDEVDDMIELTGDECHFQQHDDRYPHGWLLIQVQQLVPDPREPARRYDVTPEHVIAFSCSPGPGCEPANFGLCRYPATIEVGPWVQWTVQTNLEQWQWSSFCKTEYANRPECGGARNFRRCHLAILDLLQHAQSLGILHAVHDAAGYWENRKIVAQALGLVTV
jgi:hypothetical protein